MPSEIAVAKKRLSEINDLQASQDKEKARLTKIIEHDSVIDEWRALSAAKDKIDAFIAELDGQYTIGMLSKRFQTYYKYQNPKNAKLKTSDKDASWVKEYVASGGKIADLEETAEQSYLTSAKKALDTVRKKQTRKKKKAKAPAE